MFVISVYIAVLTGRHIADVLSVHDTKEAAIAQCRMWTQKIPDLQPELVCPGYEWFARHSAGALTVRVEKHQLEVTAEDDDEPDDEPDTVYFPTLKALSIDLDPVPTHDEPN